MFGDVWRWAGVQRQSMLNLGCRPALIAEQLEHLLRDLKSWTAGGSSFFEQAAWLHHRAVVIHPFENGNGRWSRLLANIWLRRCKEPYIEWPDATIGATSEIRDEYLAALREADQGSYAALIALSRRYAFRG
jgi:fido (protein-threonine AMPylation protein)